MQDEGHFLRLPGSNLLTTSAVPRTSGLSRRRASDSSQGLFTRFRRGASPLPWHLPPLIRHLCRLLPSTPASSSSSSSNVLVPVSTVAVSDFPLAPGEDNEVRETGKWSTRYEIRQIGTFLKWTLAPSRIMSGSWHMCLSHRCSISFRSLQKLTRTTIVLFFFAVFYPFASKAKDATVSTTSSSPSASSLAPITFVPQVWFLCWQIV